MSHCIYLERLEKQHRRENVANTEIFRAVSASEYCRIYDREIPFGSVLKILPKSIFSRKERVILSHLTGYPGTLRDLVCWDQKEPDEETYVYRVMEYIPFSLVDISGFSTDILTNIIQQIAFQIIELNIMYGVCHSRLHRGNIRVKPSSPKVTTYVISNHQIMLPTLGYEPVFLDFHWAILYGEISVESGIYNVIDSLERLCHTLSCIFVVYKDSLCVLSLEFNRRKNLEQIINLIKNFRLE